MLQQLLAAPANGNQVSAFARRRIALMSARFRTCEPIRLIAAAAALCRTPGWLNATAPAHVTLSALACSNPWLEQVCCLQMPRDLVFSCVLSWCAVQVPEFIKLICKVFWSSTFMAIPQLLVQQEHFQGWMMAFHTALRKPLPWVSLQPAGTPLSSRPCEPSSHCLRPSGMCHAITTFVCHVRECTISAG
jgi:hypothetical protein